MRFGYLASLIFCVLLTGCDQAALMKKFTPQADEAVAREYAELLRQGKFEKIEHDLDPSVADSTLSDTLSKMAALFPADPPESVKVVGAHIFHTRELSKSDITLEYQFPTKWLLVNVATQKKEDISTLVRLNVTPLTDSLENLNKFTLIGKSFLQYLTLICAVGSLLFTFYVFALCVRSKHIRPKWLWSIIVLIGFGYFSVNWGTGEWTYQLFAIQIPCFSMIHPFYGPWSVAAYFPLGAIVFLQRKMKIRGESIPEPAHSPESQASVPD
jgi:hypothetical protein